MIFMILASFVSALICLAFFEAIPKMFGYRFVPERKIHAAMLFWGVIALVCASGGPASFIGAILGSAPVALTHIRHLRQNRGRFLPQAFKGDMKRFFSNLSTQISNGVRRLLP